jgi:hypothetical protein
VKGFRFWVVIFIIGIGCLCMFSNEFELGIVMYLIACLAVGLL